MAKNRSNSSGESCKGNTKQDSQRVKWCFTLNNYTNEEVEQIKGWSSNRAKYVIFGEEVGEEGTPHLQGYVEWKKKIRFTAITKINPRISWRPAKGDKKDNFIYCSKDKNYYINGKKVRQPKVLTKDQLYGWQKAIVKICDEEPDDRTIYWVWDNGNYGKTSLAKYIFTNYKCLFVNGKGNDIKCSIALYYEKNGFYPDIILWLAPRNAEGYINYGTLEEIKDGMVFSGKYESGCFLMPNPHIFVFCNFEPDTSTLTEDRWNIIYTPDFAKPAPLEKILMH